LLSMRAKRDCPESSGGMVACLPSVLCFRTAARELTWAAGFQVIDNPVARSRNLMKAINSDCRAGRPPLFREVNRPPVWPGFDPAVVRSR
jgi:hypothetical protein